MQTKGWGAPEVEQTYARARELCHHLGSAPQLFAALRGLWEYYELRAHTGPATEIAQEILSIAERAADRTLLLIAHDVMGDNSLWIVGDFSAAHLHTAQGIALYDPALDRNLAYSYGGYDPAMACRAFGAHALWYLGYPNRAAKQSQDAVKFARDLAHPQSLVHALSHGALLHQFRRDAGLALEYALAALKCRGSSNPIFGWRIQRFLMVGLWQIRGSQIKGSSRSNKEWLDIGPPERKWNGLSGWQSWPMCC